MYTQDYDFVAGKSEYEDVLQCNNTPSSATPRGHQFPAAFMIRASGMDKVQICRGVSCMCWQCWWLLTATVLTVPLPSPLPHSMAVTRRNPFATPTWTLLARLVSLQEWSPQHLSQHSQSSLCTGSTSVKLFSGEDCA